MNCDVCRGPFSADELVSIGGKNVCAKCKPDVVMNLKSGVGAAPRIDPLKAKEIKDRISRLNLVSFALAVPGMFIQVYSAQMARGTGPDPDSTQAGILAIQGLSSLLVIAGLACYARMKGRNGFLCLLGMLSCLGLIILHFLSKICQNCGMSAGHSAKECDSCGGPV